MMRRNWILVALIGLSVAGAILRCSRACDAERDAAADTTPRIVDRTAVLQITITLEEKIVADGYDVTLAQVSSKLDGLRQRNGSVWFYCECATSDPSPAAVQVLEMAASRQLEVKTSYMRDFSDVAEELRILFREGLSAP